MLYMGIIRNILLYVLLLSSAFAVKAESGLSGEYINIHRHRAKIVIEKDKFYYVEPWDPPVSVWPDTLARCNITRAGGGFIELNSEMSPYETAMKTCKVTQTYDPACTDGVEFVFELPYNNEYYNLKIRVDQTKQNPMAFYDTSFVYTGTVKSVRMPVKADSFSFTIRQNEYSEHNLDGLFYGVCFLSSFFDYEIEPSCNRIVIEIPGLTNDFFWRYYVKGEYAKVVKKFSGTYIIWKGEKYRKVK